MEKPRLVKIPIKLVKKAIQQRRSLIEQRAANLRPVWAVRVVGWLRQLATKIEKTPFVESKGGKLLEFHKTGTSLGYPVYSVRSVRGGLYMGTVEWSNQWRRARFKPSADAVFDITCVMELYAMMRDYK